MDATPSRAIPGPNLGDAPAVPVRIPPQSTPETQEVNATERDYMLSISDRCRGIDLDREYTFAELQDWARLDALALSSIEDPKRKQFSALLVANAVEYVYGYSKVLSSNYPAVGEYVRQAWQENECEVSHFTCNPLWQSEIDFFRNECERFRPGDRGAVPAD